MDKNVSCYKLQTLGSFQKVPVLFYEIDTRTVGVSLFEGGQRGRNDEKAVEISTLWEDKKCCLDKTWTYEAVENWVSRSEKPLHKLHNFKKLTMQ